MHAGYRWFLGLDFEDPVPDRTTLIEARQRWGLETFQLIFDQVLEQCAQAGLIRGNTIVADGTGMRARAATASLLEQQVLEYLNTWSETDDEWEASADNDNGGSSEPRNYSTRRSRKAGDPDFHGETFSNATHRSRTDPKAHTLIGKVQTGKHSCGTLVIIIISWRRI